MPKFIKLGSKTPGSAPGTLTHVGKKTDHPVKINVIDYSPKGFEEKEVNRVEECFEFRDKSSVTWINVDGVHDTELLKTINDYYGVHVLVSEDIANTGHRPKLEEHDEYLFITLKMLYRDKEQKNEIVSEQISLILGKNYVISYLEDTGDVFDPVRERIRNGKGRIRTMGSDYLAYALMDAIVDNYYIVLEDLGSNIEALEDDLTKDIKPDMVHQIHYLKRSMVYLRKQIWPVREVINSLLRNESKLVSKKIDIFLRDIYDHVVQVMDTIESYRDILSSMHDIYLSVMSNKMNEIMKVLTIFSAIFIPLTFIAGIYGMNFEIMPELKWPYAYFAVLGVMVCLGGGMIAYFKKQNWF
ncbi:MAG: magnesium/cobalt transporter CorA [Candidatus Omnitrophota bacterium]